MKKMLLLMCAISCMPALLHAYKIKLTNRSPFKIQMICHLAGRSPMKTTIKPYQSGAINTVGWLAQSIDFNVINPRTDISYENFFHEKYAGGTRAGNKSFTIATDPYAEKDGTTTQVDLYLVDHNSEHLGRRVISTPVIPGKQSLSLK